MNDVTITAMSWKGPQRVADGEKDSILFCEQVAVNGIPVTGTSVGLDFGNGEDFVTLVIDDPPAELLESFTPEQVVWGSDEKTLLLSVRSIEVVRVESLQTA